MELDQSFSLPLNPDDAHALLLDLERVTPCLPGAQITGRIDERHYDADMGVRIGPIRMTYRGRIEIVDVDTVARAAILHAEAKDARGRGSARADMHMKVTPEGDGSQVHVRTHLDLTGRVAQMGRGVVQDVAGDLMDQFAANLARVAGADEGTSLATAPPRSTQAARARPGTMNRGTQAGGDPVTAPSRPIHAPTPASSPAAASIAPATAPPKAPNAFAMLWRILMRRLRGSSVNGTPEGRVR